MKRIIQLSFKIEDDGKLDSAELGSIINGAATRIAMNGYLETATVSRAEIVKGIRHLDEDVGFFQLKVERC